jgi:(p)ppGpp synthase/HD superfamily hydrolase
MVHAQGELAQSIAVAAHKGQVDKAGMPYIEHPAHVAASVQGDVAKAVAWLHDVVEDTPLTLADLRGKGVAPEVVEALKLLTHDESVPYLEYVRSLKSNPLACAVKLADLRHNSDLSRLPRITEKDQRRAEKYAKAIAILEGEGPEGGEQ